MKQVSAFAFKRPGSAWLLLTADEDARLDGFEAWFFKLFACLVKWSDFRTGYGRTGYGELVNALTPDQPERGPRLWAPSRDDVRQAVRRLEAAGLVAVDRVKSEKAKALFFHVPPRTRTGAPARKLPPELHPTSTEGEAGKLPPSTPPGDSEKNSHTARAKLPVDNRPDGAKIAAAREVSRRIAARGKKRAPEGA